MRALDHAVEGLYRTYPNTGLGRTAIPPPVKHLYGAAIADLFKYLRASKADPTDAEVRQKLQIAAWMSLWPIKFDRPR